MSDICHYCNTLIASDEMSKPIYLEGDAAKKRIVHVDPYACVKACRAEVSRLNTELTALRPGPTTPAVCRALARFWTKMAENMEAAAPADEESER